LVNAKGINEFIIITVIIIIIIIQKIIMRA